MNLLLTFAVLIAVPTLLALAVRRIAGGDGIGLVELVEAAVAPFVPSGPRGRAVPEPDFEPWRSAAPRVSFGAAPRDDRGRAFEELPTAA